MDKTTERIKADAEADFKAAKIEWSETYALGRHDGYIAGAMVENERAQPIADTLKTLLEWHTSQIHITHEGLSRRIEEAHEALQQWRGTEKEHFTGSTFTSPAQGITLGCISPEARDLLDTIMEEWEAHYKTVKTDTYEPTFYGFAYWLVRWSGLVQPINTNPTK